MKTKKADPNYFSKNCCFTFIISFLLLLSISSFAQADLGEYTIDLSDFDFTSNNTVELNEKWLFAPNRLLTNQDVKSINNYLEVPGRFNKKFQDTLYGTYAVKINTGDFKDILGLKINTISSSYKLFINHKLILESGVVGKDKETSKPERIPKVIYFAPPSNEFWIIIQVSDFYNYRGGIWYPIEIGSSDAISRKEKIATANDLFVFGILIFISIYHLILYLFRRKNGENLSIAGLSATIFIRNSLMGERMMLYIFDNVNFNFVIKLQTIVIAYALYFYADFLNRSFPKHVNKKLLTFNKYLVVLATVVGAITGIQTLVYILYLLQVIILIEVIYISFVIISGFLKGERRLIYPLAGAVIFFATVVNDILLDNLVINSVYLTPIGLVIFMLFNSLLTAKKFSDAYNTIEENSIEIDKLNLELMDLNRNLEEKVEERTFELSVSNNSLKNIMNNTEDGFITFNYNLKVGKEYSKICYDIFGEDIEYRNITELLQLNTDDAKFFENIITKTSVCKAFKIKVFLSLLPTNVKINNSTYEIQYKYIYNPKTNSDQCFLMKLKDITQEIELEKTIEKEKSRIKRIIKVMTDRNMFVDISNNYENFLLNFESKYSSSSYEDFNITVHTFKGNLAQYKMDNSVEALHNFENILTEKDNSPEILQEELSVLRNSYKKDLESISEVLGDNFLKNVDNIFVPETLFESIKLKLINSAKFMTKREIESEIMKMKYHSFKDVLLGYRYYTEELIAKLGKVNVDFIINGHDIRFDNSKYSALTKSLTHIFRNIVDHGLETPEERSLTQKEETAKIVCEIYNQGSNFIIKIRDDGRGIDIDKIRAKFDSNLKNALHVSREELFQKIFESGISTKDKVNNISGRGIGLNSVKREIEKLGGNIEVKSEKGKYTEFIITLKNSENIIPV